MALDGLTNQIDHTYVVDNSTNLASGQWSVSVYLYPLYPFKFGNGSVKLDVYGNSAMSRRIGQSSSSERTDGTKYDMNQWRVFSVTTSSSVDAYGKITSAYQLTEHTPPPIVNNIANTTASGAGVTYKGYKITVIFTSGAADPNVEYTVSYSRYNTSSTEYETVEDVMTLNDDGTLTVVCDYPQWDDAEHPITLSSGGGGAPDPVEGSVINQIKGADMEYTRDGSTLSISLSSTAVSNNYRYYGVQLSYVDTSGANKTVDVQSGNSDRLTFSVSDYDSTKDATVTGSLEYSILISGSFTNCTVTGLREYYRLTDTLNVTLTANEGDTFGDDERPVLTYKDRRNNSYAIDCEVSEGGGVATFSTDVLSSYNIAVYLAASGGATPVTVIRQYGTVNYYRVTLDQLDEFARKRFFTVTLSGESSQLQSIDLGDFVTKLKRLYCDVPTFGTDTIHCGNYNTRVSVSVPRSDVLTLDFGAITIPTYNSSSLDFQSEFTLYAPFVGNVSIPSDWAGRALGLRYLVNTFVCQAVCVISIDGNEIEHRECDPTTNLYYVVSNSTGAVGDDNYTVSYLSGLEPYLLVKHWTALPAFANSTVSTVKLGDANGFVAVDDHYTPPLSGALGDEIEEVGNLLHNGVYIR